MADPCSRTAAMAAGLLLIVAVAARPAAADDACDALAAPGVVPGVVPGASEVSAVATPSDPETGAPAHCEVTATLAPAEGSHIGVVYRLPEAWNGKLLGLGGGGWMGNTRLQTAVPGLARGYATMQTDGGHAPAAGFDTSWAVDADGHTNEVAVEDFAFRAVHAMTEAGKAVAAAYYGRTEEHAYWQGCSTGGRQGLMEVQRYPADYDGVIAGAPVYDFRTQTSGWVRNMDFLPAERRLSPAHLELINHAVVAACDGADGAEDGVIQDPRDCAWDPGELACPAGESGDECLTPPQVDAVRVAYEGVLIGRGEVAAFPLSRGTELSWRVYARPLDAPASGNESALPGLNEALFDDPSFDMADFTPERDVPRVRASAMAGMYEADDAAIGDFIARGGKLILYHGFYDNAPSPLATVEYYQRVLAEADAPDGADQSARLFLMPGMGHCRGGPGADRVDWLDALESWVEDDRAPDEIPATKADSDLAWPLCPYPQLPRARRDADGGVSYACQ